MSWFNELTSLTTMSELKDVVLLRREDLSRPGSPDSRPATSYTSTYIIIIKIKIKIIIIIKIVII